MIAVVLFEGPGADRKPLNKEAFRERVGAWWESQAPEGHAGNGAAYEVPDGMRWWAHGRRAEVMGRGKDVRGGEPRWRRAGQWDRLLGAMGFAPPGYSRVLQDAGVPKAMAKATVTGLSKVMREGSRELWSTRCAVQQEKEAEKGITSEMKRDKELAREHRGRGRGISKRDRAALRALEGVREVEVVERDELGRVTGRHCAMADCDGYERGRGRFCDKCGARLPGRRRGNWEPEAREGVGVCQEEDVFWGSVAKRKVREGDVGSWPVDWGWVTAKQLREWRRRARGEGEVVVEGGGRRRGREAGRTDDDYRDRRAKRRRLVRKAEAENMGGGE